MGETGNRAVFLSYASQDAEAAKKICEALRQAGVEVWFDQSELRGGDAWDQKIRRQIKECTLFMPVISANTNARPEGYFRLEWKLAVDRSHLMADDEPFLFPISIGDVKDATARVPDKFRDVQWTHLRLDETPAELAKRVGRLLKQGAGSPEEGASAEGAGKRAARPRSGGWNWWMIFPIIGAVMGLMFAAVPLWKAMNGATPKSPPPSPAVKAKADAPAVSEARQMTLKARNLFEGIDSTVDDYKTAEGLLQRASALDPTDGFIWAVYSRLNTGYSMRGFDFAPARQEEARSQMERAIRLAPDEAEAWLARGSYLRRTAGDRAEAEKALRKAIELAPQDKRAWFDLAWAVGAPGGSSDDEILALLDKSIDPERPGTAALAHYNQFLLLFGGRRFAEADAKIRQSVSELPSANFVTGLARSELTWKGDAAAAVAAIDVMTGEKKREARSVWFAAYAHLLARQPDAALADLRLLPGDFIEDSFFSGPKAYWEGRAQQQLGNADAARVAWETALAVSRREGPGRAKRGLLMQAELLAYLNRPDEALQAVHAYEQATTGGKKRGAQAWITSSARVYVLLGRFDDALPMLEADLKASGVAWPLTPALLQIDPVWEGIRSDPRFQKLVADAETKKPDLPGGDAPEKSVAVLAFANLSDDKANEYFSDGISEELLNVLAKVPGLKVSARTSAFYFKGKEVPVPEIARQLGVAYIVEGSVRKAGDKVRITAQLIKAADGFHVWSDSFTRDLKDIFAVQDEIAGLIAQQLQVKMLATAAVRPVDPEAHRLVLEGRHFWNLRTTEGFDRAESAFRRALELDPTLAPAHAGLALVLATRIAYKAYSGEITDSGALVRAAAQSALDLDPASVEARAAIAYSYFSEGRLAESEREYRQALALNPNAALLHHWYSLTLEIGGRLDEALAEVTRATELDPLSGIALITRERHAMYAGRYSEALAMHDRAVGLLPDLSAATGIRALCFLQLGRNEDAVAAARELSPQSSLTRRIMADAEIVHVLRRTGHQAEAEAHAAAILPRFLPDSYQRGAVLAALGRFEEGVPFLERTPPTVRYIFLWDPVWDAYRGKPEFAGLIAKLGYEEQYRTARATLAKLQRDSAAK